MATSRTTLDFSPLHGNILWVGDDSQAKRLTPLLESLGYGLVHVATAEVSSTRDVRGTLVLLSTTGRDDVTKVNQEIGRSLDLGLNTILVQASSYGRQLRGKALADWVRSKDWQFADGAAGPGDEPRQQLQNLSLIGGELRQCTDDIPTIVHTLRQSARPIPDELHSFPGLPLADIEGRLLSIAFHDCREIKLKELPGGRSGASVWIVKAKKNKDDLTPFVVKVDSRAAIIKEIQQYEYFVRDLLPFRARPSLVQGRCAVLASKGVMVGRFVERNVTILESVKHGHAIEIINDLFGSIMRQWWGNSEPFSEQHLLLIGDSTLKRWIRSPSEGSKAARRLDRCYADAGRIYPGLHTPQKLRHVFEHRLDKVRVGRIHGDLNASNVLAQAARAFIIDFTHNAHAPSLLDPAWLEVTLAFNWADDRCFSRAAPNAAIDDEWRQAIEVLYARSSIEHLPASDKCHAAHSDIGAVAASIHAIRYHAHSISFDRRHYSYFVLAALVRLASANCDSPSPSMVYAYKVASGLASELLVETV